jgi:hypothetical protein
MKKCTKCLKNKDESKFSKKHSFTNKLKDSCMDCINKANAERYKKLTSPK